MDQFPLAVEADHFTTGPEAGIDGEDILLAKGRREKKLSEFFDKDAYRLLIGPLFCCQTDLRLHGGREKSLVAIVQGHPDLLGCKPFPFDKKAIEDLQGFVFRGDHPQREKALLFASP